MKDQWIKITSIQLKLLLEMVKGFFISNAVVLSAKKCRNISISVKYPNEIWNLLRAEDITAAKNLLANSCTDNLYRIEVVFTVIPSLMLALYQ